MLAPTCGLNLKNLFNYKTILVLLFVVAVNIIVAVLLWQLDFFVHGDLYSYGLVYSRDWANPYWYYTVMLWAFLGGAIGLAGTAIAPHYLHSRKNSRLSTWTGFFLSAATIFYEGFCVFLFYQKIAIINSLSSYGVSSNNEWVTTYSLLSQTVPVLLTIAFVALIIPAVKALSLKKIIRR